jgi:hypothetical protein
MSFFHLTTLPLASNNFAWSVGGCLRHFQRRTNLVSKPPLSGVDSTNFSMASRTARFAIKWSGLVQSNQYYQEKPNKR